ncbi:MAG TPA: DUF2071 domain-containing protein, partial [Bacteroidetes bacterium]|nr:DUF2071 domain-containing protein [Bacteroidota bacterium]
LVAFMFKDTKILGVKIPFHVNFEEVNLRFYVRHKADGEYRRGVVFIKEIVPKGAISFVANTFYNENYETRKMRHVWNKKPKGLQVQYEWLVQNQWQKITADAKKEAVEIAEKSEAEFITEHYYGYTKKTQSKSYEYEVTHPRWKQYVVKDYKIEIDYGLVYGEKFAFLKNQEPVSVMLAEGSVITVENKRVI